MLPPDLCLSCETDADVSSLVIGISFLFCFEFWNGLSVNEWGVSVCVSGNLKSNFVSVFFVWSCF